MRHSSLSTAAQARSRPSGLRPSAVPVTMVCGPAASGKSTYIAEHAGRRDLVIDLDEIITRCTGGRYGRERPAWVLEAALKERNKVLRSLASLSPSQVPRVWFIIAAPDRAEREWWAAQLGIEQVVVLDTPLEECERRIRLDPDRRAGADRMVRWARDWWATYQLTSSK